MKRCFGDEPRYVMVTVVMPAPMRAGEFFDPQTISDFLRVQAEEVLNPVIAFADRHRWLFQTRYLAGPTAKSISLVAEEVQPDLIVMGTHGHSALANVVLGLGHHRSACALQSSRFCLCVEAVRGNQSTVIKCEAGLLAICERNHLRRGHLHCPEPA